MTAATLEAALRAARAFIAAEQAVLLATVAEPGTDGQPDRDTIEPIDRPAAEAFDAILAEIDAALAAGGRP